MSVRGMIVISALLMCATNVFAQQWCVSVSNTSAYSEASLPNYFTDPPVQPAVPSTYYVRFFKKPGTAEWTHDTLPKKSLEEWLAANTVFNSRPTSDSLKVTCTYRISKPIGSEQIDGIRRGPCFESSLPSKPKEVATKEEDEWLPVEREPGFDYSALQRAVKYPVLARLHGIQGQVVVAALVSETGAVSKVKVIETDSPYLNDAAAQAVFSTSFTPAIVNSKPSICWVRIPLRFQLR